MINEFKEINDVYQIALSKVYELTGLELSLIEKVALRRITSVTVKEAKKVKSAWSEFNPGPEAAVRFIKDYYGCDVDDDDSFFMKLRIDAEKKKEPDPVVEYFRRKQEEYHKP